MVRSQRSPTDNPFMRQQKKDQPAGHRLRLQRWQLGRWQLSRTGQGGKGTASEAALAVLITLADDTTLDSAMRAISGAVDRGDDREFWLRASLHLQAGIEGNRQRQGRQPYWQERAAEGQAQGELGQQRDSFPPPTDRFGA
jgi:hypothetical protein